DRRQLGEPLAQAQLIAHGGEQPGAVDRFGDEIGHPGAHRALLEAGQVVTAEGDDRDVTELLAREDVLGQAVAVHPRHVQVEKNQSDRLLVHHAHRFPSAVDADARISLTLEKAARDDEVVLLVIDEKNDLFSSWLLVAIHRAFDSPPAFKKARPVPSGSLNMSVSAGARFVK